MPAYEQIGPHRAIESNKCLLHDCLACLQGFAAGLRGLRRGSSCGGAGVELFEQLHVAESEGHFALSVLVNAVADGLL